MNDDKSQNYLHGAAILTAGVLIMKVLGFLYKVPIANIIGPDGYSMFFETYSVYNVFLTLSTAGLPIALARMISEANAEKREMQTRRTFSVAWWTFFVIGLVFSLIMLLFSKQLAADILHNPPAAASIRAMAPSVLLVCLVSAFRGYTQGKGNMVPTTVGQVLEVLVKVAVGLSLSYVLIRSGKNKAIGSAGAIFGVTAGSLAALLYMYLYKKKYYPEHMLEDPDRPDSDREILFRFLKIGIPIAVGSSVLAILNLVDSSLCMGRLQSAAGFSLEKAQTLYGVYGEAQTLFNLPAALITPMTIAVVPAITAAIVKGENDNATKISEDSMRIVSALAMPMGIGLAVLSEPIMRVIYKDGHEAAPTLLAIMGLAAFFVCMVLMENAILQAAGKELLPMITLVIGGLAKVILNYFLVADPRIHIYGAPVGTFASYLIMFVINFVFMCFVLDKNPKLHIILVKPLACSAVMGLSAWISYRIFAHFLHGGRIMMMACLAMAMAIAIVIYLVMTVAFRMLTKEDMQMIPGGEKVAKLLHMR